jgi:hypothetical protein
MAMTTGWSAGAACASCCLAVLACALISFVSALARPASALSRFLLARVWMSPMILVSPWWCRVAADAAGQLVPVTGTRDQLESSVLTWK